MTMKQTRWGIAILGILVPYLSRIPGTFTHGSTWLTSYFGDNLWAPFFFGAFNAVCWGLAIAATFTYRNTQPAGLPAVFALTSSFWMHSTVDLAADAQAAIALIIIPFLTIPFTATGWILGYLYDRYLIRRQTLSS